MTLLDRLGTDLPSRCYLGVDVGYKEHVAVVIPLETFVRGDGRWKRATCVHFPSTQAGLCTLQPVFRTLTNDKSAQIESLRNEQWP